jgi:hypothetical protein
MLLLPFDLVIGMDAHPAVSGREAPYDHTGRMAALGWTGRLLNVTYSVNGRMRERNCTSSVDADDFGHGQLRVRDDRLESHPV